MEKVNMFAYFPKIYTLYFILIVIGVFLVSAFFQNIFIKRLFTIWEGGDAIEKEIYAKLISKEKKGFLGIFKIRYIVLFLTEEGQNLTFRLNKHDIRFMVCEEEAQGKLTYKGSKFVDFVECEKEESL